jgi:RimJ/RimL family protein N-acetyltransferase/GNAT superfamily N-acetyltransferase
MSATFSAGSYEIDDDPGRIDLDAAVAFLTTQAYWARWRGADDIKEQITQAWRMVGVYDPGGAMVGLARAMSDGASAYLADVYVLPEHRGAGLGKALIRAMIEDGPGAGYRWMLHTSDAHGLYREFGFAAPDGRYLERPRSQPGARPAADPLGTGTLAGPHVRLEPLGYRHAPGLLAATAGGGDLYRWSPVPRDAEQVRRYVETAHAMRDRRAAVAYAVVRTADETVIGSTRFHQLDYWAWPDRDASAAPPAPDTCEIGWTWLSKDAIRTAANTEMKRLMLTHAFETWQVKSVCLHTDVRNQRSRAAMERFGARFEGVLRAHRLATELIPRDSARYSVTAAEWPQVKRHIAGLSRRLSQCLVQRHDVVLQAEDRGLGAVGQAQLGQDAGDVALDRLLGDRQGPGDLAVGTAPGDLAQHVGLARGEQLERAGRGAAAEFADQPGGGRGLQDALAAGGGADRLDHLVHPGRLRQERQGAGLHRGDEVVAVL